MPKAVLELSIHDAALGAQFAPGVQRAHARKVFNGSAYPADALGLLIVEAANLAGGFAREALPPELRVAVALLQSARAAALYAGGPK